MTKIKELEAKIGGLEFSIEHMRISLENSINVIDKLEAERMLTEFERGMRYQANMLKDFFKVNIECGEKLSKELLLAIQTTFNT